MQDLTFHCADHKLAVSALDGHERLGEASRFELELVSVSALAKMEGDSGGSDRPS